MMITEKANGAIMRFINCSYEIFLRKLNNRKIVQFGASSAWGYFASSFPDIGREVVDKTLCVVDNSPDKQGSFFDICGRIIKVEAPDILERLSDYVILIIVSVQYQEKICQQLEEMGLPMDTECYSLPLMLLGFDETDNSAVDEYFRNRKNGLIPSKIHSFWFSGEEKPDLYKRCIESWYKYCPEFEIIEWNAENYDVTQNRYMLEAFENRKWAFVSDFARLDVIYRYGGVYLDMDVELVAPLAPYLRADAFFCRQEDGMLDLGSGFGARAENSLVGEALDSYKDRRLIKPDGSLDKMAQPEMLNPIFIRNGFHKSHDSQIVGECIVFSNDYITCYAGTDSVANAKLGIHWHNGGWLEENDRKNIQRAIEAREPLLKKYFR